MMNIEPGELMKKDMPKVPKLRFPEFDGEWESKILQHTGMVITGSTPPTSNSEYYGGKKLFVSPVDIQGNRYVISTKTTLTESGFKKGRLIKKGSIFFVCIGSTIGKVGQAGEDCITNQQINSVIVNNNHDENFIYSLLEKKSSKIKRLAGEQAVPIVNKSTFEKFRIATPSLLEQQKIASFFSAVDKKIQQLSRKKELLGQYKKGVMQKIFSQEIRFGFDSAQPPESPTSDTIPVSERSRRYRDWQEKRLNELLYESKVRNYDLKFDKKDVLSVSGEHGIVNQIEFQGRSFAGESVANYHVVETGDVVYTKSPLKANPYGIIKVNKGPAGIVSTLYAVYKCKETALGEYLDYYFQLDDHVNGYLRPLVHKGAKNDMKISNSRVLIDPIWIPGRAEQDRAVEFFKSLDKKIKMIQTQLTQTQTYKKGLLQQMFV